MAKSGGSSPTRGPRLDRSALRWQHARPTQLPARPPAHQAVAWLAQRGHWPPTCSPPAPGPRPPALPRCGGGGLLIQWSPVRSLAQRQHGWHIGLAQGRWLGAAMTTCSHHACAWHEERKGNAIDLPSLLQWTDRRI